MISRLVAALGYISLLGIVVVSAVAVYYSIPNGGN
ncbi:hypothetical protein SZ00_02572 [Rhodococcus sp. AD45]|nr:hypothetical protein SZ00_02572 [Rhodococcus sp. AD45]